MKKRNIMLLFLALLLAMAAAFATTAGDESTTTFYYWNPLQGECISCNNPPLDPEYCKSIYNGPICKCELGAGIQADARTNPSMTSCEIVRRPK